MEKVISVFGTARSTEKDPEYQEAMTLGKQLAEAGFTVSTGGHGGAMEAISRGAHEANGKVIGITFESMIRQAEPNPWLHEVIEEADLFTRIKRLTKADGLVAVAGGAGTLAEVSMAWNLLQTGGMEPKPVILLGERWHELVQSMEKNLIINEEDLAWLRLVDRVEDVITILNQELK